MQRQCPVQKGSHQGLVALGEQGRITLAAQFTDKDGPREVGGALVHEMTNCRWHIQPETLARSSQPTSAADSSIHLNPSSPSAI